MDIVLGVYKTTMDIVLGVYKTTMDIVLGVYKTTMDIVLGVYKTTMDVVLGVMMWIFYLLSSIMIERVAGKECTFSKDCFAENCLNTTDHLQLPGSLSLSKPCSLCKFGTCFKIPQIDGTECKDVIDCPCSTQTPETCFCQFGKCFSDPKDKFECRTSEECSNYEKCSNKLCTCSGNLCEYQCETAEDCEKGGYFCKNVYRPEFKCKCEKNICVDEKIAEECSNIKDCSEKGKCSSDEPCECSSKICKKPSWSTKYPANNCRDNFDCKSVPNCEKGSCTCENKKDGWGSCKTKKEKESSEDGDKEDEVVTIEIENFNGTTSPAEVIDQPEAIIQSLIVNNGSETNSANLENAIDPLKQQNVLGQDYIALPSEVIDQPEVIIENHTVKYESETENSNSAKSENATDPTKQRSELGEGYNQGTKGKGNRMSKKCQRNQEKRKKTIKEEIEKDLLKLLLPRQSWNGL
ncbi:uncharacterized protein LOC111702040 [Eurytemora carolleeae]|uniref:uncharacterized protein LOC111702040 n=1 Tax=Eurytemora carolleeae TaxID=1294199 RepID=UPI000C7781AA|nr:uncharacterized protein LOC111702040 [Eurytemora carolleeae]|eukprot:XP_023329331.1 uncharacterized protein LOC111702040 [Eurytemora affinis]